MRLKVLNSKGQPILLNQRDGLAAAHQQKILNSLGYEIDITSLTTIIRAVTEQTFYEIAFADYLPTVVGEGSWSSQLTKYRSFQLGGEFEDGITDLGSNNARLAAISAGVDSVTTQVYNWGKTIGWSIMELQQASKSGNWDLVSTLERSRKQNWDLGLQRVAFLGARGSNASGGSCLGLLNQAGVSVNTSIITKPISSMTTTELKAFTAALIEAYRSNNQRTAWPTTFVIPESDYNGLASQASPDFPIKSTLELLEEAFKLICRNKNFKILPLAYADAAYHADVPSIVGKQCYVLLNYNSDSLALNVPVDYTTTVPNSLDNFVMQCVGYGQFTGVQTYKPLELLYLQYTA